VESLISDRLKHPYRTQGFMYVSKIRLAEINNLPWYMLW